MSGSKRKFWSSTELVELARIHGVVRVSWHWRNRQKLRAALRACKKGRLRRVQRSTKGADLFEFVGT